MRAPRLLALLLPPALCLVPLLIGQQAQEGGDPPEKGGDDAEASEPTRTAGSSLAIVSLPRAGAYAQDDRLRDAPFLVARRDGRATLGWLEYVPAQGDLLMVLTAPVEKLASSKTALQSVNLTPAPLLRPVGVVDRDDRLHIFWTELVAPVGAAGGASGSGVGQLRGAREQLGGFPAPLVLTSGPQVRMNADAALAADGRIWLAFEGEEAVAPAASTSRKLQRDIWAAPLAADGMLGDAVRISDSAWSDVDARIVAVDAKLWIAWSSFTGRDYEIRLRSLDPKDGALGPVIDVSARSQADDVHPTLAAAPDGALWVAWDSSSNALRGDSTPPQMRLARKRVEIEVSVRCARVLQDGTVALPVPRTKGLEPGIVEGALSFSIAGGLPSLAFDARGKLWIAYRQLIGAGSRKAHSWSVLLQSLGSEGFDAPFEVAGSASTLAETALASAGDRMIAAFVMDHVIDRNAGLRAVPPNVEHPLAKLGVRFDWWRGPFGVGVAQSAPAAEDAPPVVLPPLVARTEELEVPHFHPAGDPQADPYVAGTAHYEIARGEQRYQVFWGDLHRHSCISRCSAGFEPTPQDRFATGRDVHLCDFMALTDHSGQIHPLAWWRIDKLTQLYRSPGFVTLAGYEWSTSKWGHHNVILPGGLAPFIGQISDLDDLFDRLPAGEAVTIPHHPADNAFANDYTVCDDRFTRLIEVFQSRRGSYEFDGCFKQAPNAGALGSFVQDALQQGHYYGIIASSDHAEGQAYACVLAESLDRRALFDALKARRTYGATTKGMLIDLRVDDAVMGEAVTISAPPRVRVTARGLKELAEVVVFRNGKVWQRAGAPMSAEWNRFSMLHVVARVAADAGPLTVECELALKVKGGRFAGVLEKRPYARRHEVPEWEVDGPRATLTCPVGFDAQPFFRDFPIRVQADLDTALEVTLPGVELKRQLTLRELHAAPLTAELPGGALLTVTLDLGDGAIDYQHGIGQRDFTAEWVDDDMRSGKSWYYARILQVDGEMAWSSPIFVQSP